LQEIAETDLERYLGYASPDEMVNEIAAKTGERAGPISSSGAG